jgi:hypothetical protein
VSAPVIDRFKARFGEVDDKDCGKLWFTASF